MPAFHPNRSFLQALVLLAALAAAPATAADAALPDDLARAVAQLEHRLRTDPRRVDAPEVEAWMQGILCRLDPVGCGRLRPLLMRQSGFNAAIAPGGLLVVRTGALLRCRDEAELAVVLAHELAHERRGDALGRWRTAGDGEPRNSEHTREAETAADAAAFAMIAAAGYDVAAGERLWARLQAEEAAVGMDRDAPGTHPSASERLAAFHAARQNHESGAGAGGDRNTGGGSLLERTLPYRQAWLDEEVARGRPAATVAMLRAVRTADAEPQALDDVALGQALRRRGAIGDDAEAAALFANVTGQPAPPAAAWREDGLARLDAGDGAGGRAALAHYLEREPGAADADFVAAMLADAKPAERVDRLPPEATGPEIRVFDLRLRTALPWTRQRGIALEQWSIGGVDASRLLIVPNLRPDEPLFRDAGRNGPRYQPGLRPDEQRDRILTALDSAGWLDVLADGPRPHDFGGLPGWQSNVSLASAEGVRYRGSAVFVERNGRLTLLLWFATAQAHFQRDAAAVEAMFASLRFDD